MGACADYEEASPENGACAWCARYRIHLDRAGALCRRCRSEAVFRESLAMQAAVRFGDCAGGTSYCERFRTPTDEAQCARCHEDPLFRAFLRGQALARRPAHDVKRSGRCVHRGEDVKAIRRRCCGNEERWVTLFRCARHGTAHDGRCAVCGDWVAQA